VTPAPKRKRGRPPGSGAGRTDVVRMRLTPEQRARYLAAAEAIGVTLTEWACEAMDAACER
jgi:hypothetical protein